MGNPWRSGRDFSGMVGIPGIIGSDGLRKIWKRPPFFTVTAGMGMWFGRMDGDTKSCKTFKVFECITVFFVRIKSIKLTLCQVVIFNYRDHKKTAGSIQHLLGGFRLATRGRESFQVFQLYKPITPQMEANHSEVLGEQSSFWISWTPPGWFVCSCWKFFETFPPDILESSFQKKIPQIIRYHLIHLQLPNLDTFKMHSRQVPSATPLLVTPPLELNDVHPLGPFFPLSTSKISRIRIFRPRKTKKECQG